MKAVVVQGHLMDHGTRKHQNVALLYGDDALIEWLASRHLDECVLVTNDLPTGIWVWEGRVVEEDVLAWGPFPAYTAHHLVGECRAPTPEEWVFISRGSNPLTSP